MTARAAMAGDLRLDPSSPTKTFVLDVHPDGATEPIEFLSHVVGDGLVEPTDDAWLYRVDVADGRFWVDQLDERFWSFHTDMATASAKRFLHERVEAHRTLDWMWLPSEHLRRAWPDT